MASSKMDYLLPALISVVLLAKDIANQYEKGWQKQAKTYNAREIITSFCNLKRETLHSNEIGF